MLSPGPTGTLQQHQQNNPNLLKLIPSAADVKSLKGDTVCLLFSVICPPEGLGTVDRTTTHRTAFIAALCYQHRCSLIPSEPPWTPTDTGPTIQTARGRDPLSPSTAGPPILEVCPLSMTETEDEAPILLLLHCPTILQTGTTGQIINSNNKNLFHHFLQIHSLFFVLVTENQRMWSSTEINLFWAFKTWFLSYFNLEHSEVHTSISFSTNVFITNEINILMSKKKNR